MREINEVIYEVKQYSSKKPVKEERWVSTRAPGTPACVEALFDMYEQGKADKPSFQFGLNYTRLTEKEFFDAYEMFLEGKVMEKIARLDHLPVQTSMLFRK